MAEKTMSIITTSDITNLFLLYRKLSATSYDKIGVYITPSANRYANILNQSIINLLPKLYFLGPTMIYEDYINMANFPRYVDLEDYEGNVINLDIIHHLKSWHIDDIYPAQKTDYNFKIQVRPDRFNKWEFHASNVEGAFHLGINCIDPLYDNQGCLIDDLHFAVSAIKEQTKCTEVYVYLFGLAPMEMLSEYMEKVKMKLPGVPLIDCTHMDYDLQIGMLHALNLFISGPYTYGHLAYTMGIPSIILYPFYMSELKGHTVSKESGKNVKYVELLDEQMPSMINNILSGMICSE